MKIAYIFTEFPSGQVSNISRVLSMAERNHDITIFANTKGVNETLEIALDRFSHKIKVIYISRSIKDNLKEIMINFFINPIKFMRVIKLVSDKRFFFQNYTKRIIGGRGKKANFLVVKRKLKILTSYLRYTKLIDREFDIIVSFFGTLGNQYLFLKEIYPQTPFLTYFVGFDYSSQVYRTADINLYKDLFIKTDYIMAKSNFSRQTLISLGCNPDKVKIDYNGININFFKCRNFVLPIDVTIKFIIVSRLEKKKCHLLILEAFLKILAEYQNFKFTIVGQGPEFQNIKKYLNDNTRLNSKVDLLGEKTHLEIRDLLVKNHIFIHPSSASIFNGSMEDTPTSILEAMACGLPIISTYHAGIPDLVINDYNGKLVPERNLDLLTDTIKAFMGDTRLINKLGKNSRDLIEKKFDLKKNTLNNEIFYEDLIK